MTETAAASLPANMPGPWSRPEFVRLLAISLTVALGFGMVIPALPIFAKSFGVGLAVLGLVQLVFGLTRFSFALVGGLVVDRFGDRACTMIGLLVVAVSSYGVGFSTNFTQLVLARGFGGMGSALFIAGLMNRILRIIEPEMMGRATGAFRASFLVGIVVGPAMGGFVVAVLGVEAVFHLYATGLLVATLIAWFVMAGGGSRASAQERKNPIESLRAARPLFSDRRYVIALLATFVGWWTISGPTQVIGTVYAIEELQLSPSEIGWALTSLAIGEVVVVLGFAGPASDRYGRAAVLVPSLIVVAISTALLGQIQDVPVAYFPLLFLIGTGVAAASTASGGLLADSIPKAGSGAAVGVNQMAGDLGYLISPTAVGFVAESASFRTAYLVAAVPALAVFFASLTLQRTRTSPDEQQTPEPSAPVG